MWQFLEIYADTNISISHCRELLGKHFASDGGNFLENLCGPVKMLVREISMDGASVLEITHKPIAKLLVKQAVTLEQKSINQFLKDFLAKEKK